MTVYHAIVLTLWGWMTHICVGNLTIIRSDNGLSPGRHQTIIQTNAGISFNGPLGTNFSEILIKIHTFSFKKMHLKMLSGKRWSVCLSLNVLMPWCENINMPLWWKQKCWHCEENESIAIWLETNMLPLWWETIRVIFYIICPLIHLSPHFT